MLRNVVAVKVLDTYRLTLEFDDHVSGEVDIAAMVPFRGVFELLAEPDYFAQVRVDAELGTICWPNGADIDADVLYSAITGLAPQFDVVSTDPEAYARRWQALVANPEVQRLLHEMPRADRHEASTPLVETNA